LHSHDQHTHRLLTEIEASGRVSQRSLARSLGIALGLTNFLLRRVVRKGWVRMIQIQPNRVSYLLTPTGIAEKAKMSRDSLQYSVRFYKDARERIGGRFASLSAACEDGDPAGKRILFYGAGEVAEIGYVCLQETDLKLIAAIDDVGRKRFFDVPIYPREALKQPSSLEGTFDRLVIMRFENSETINEELDGMGVEAHRVFWV